VIIAIPLTLVISWPGLPGTEDNNNHEFLKQAFGL
jgi:hypothetical protein